VKPGNLSCHNYRHDVGAKFRGMKIHFREMRKNNYLFGFEEVFLFLD